MNEVHAIGQGINVSDPELPLTFCVSDFWIKFYLRFFLL
jgi:hypothetical protein